jgi:DUF4097 and DUF4098 domain-containing protein YvlB
MNLKTSKIIIGGVAIAAILAVLLISGCTQVTTVEHREDKTLHDAAGNIDLTVTTMNGYVEIQESTDYKVEVIYDITAPTGHLQHITTGTNGSRDGNTLTIKAEAKLADPNERPVINHGANVIVKVPKNSTYNLTITTSNGKVTVPQLNGTRMVIDTSNGDVDITAGNYSVIDAASSNGDIGVKLQNGTQFFVDASTSNGRVRHGMIHMLPDSETDTSLVGYTESGHGNLRMVLQTSNGDVDISYV